MQTSSVMPPESILRALSKPKGREVAKAAGQLLRLAASQTDHALLERSIHLLRRASSVVKKALPDTDPELIGGFFANLLDLWETGQKLDKELQKLTKLRMPHDRERLRDILLWIEAIQLDMGSFWIREVKKDMSKLYKALDRLERRSVRGNQKPHPRNAQRKAKLKRS
jgi:hypothetical protein